MSDLTTAWQIRKLIDKDDLDSIQLEFAHYIFGKDAMFNLIMNTFNENKSLCKYIWQFITLAPDTFDVNKQYSAFQGMNIWWYALFEVANDDVFQTIMLFKGIDINCKNDSPFRGNGTVFHFVTFAAWASRTRWKMITESFEIDFNALNDLGETPLEKAYDNGEGITLKFLLENGCDGNELSEMRENYKEKCAQLQASGEMTFFDCLWYSAHQRSEEAMKAWDEQNGDESEVEENQM